MFLINHQSVSFPKYSVMFQLTTEFELIQLIQERMKTRGKLASEGCLSSPRPPLSLDQ